MNRLYALADALENLADEVMTLDYMGPIDYIGFKIENFLMDVVDFITDLTSESKKEKLSDDDIWEEMAEGFNGVMLSWPLCMCKIKT